MAEHNTITISGVGKNVTMSGEQFDHATTQLPLFPVDKAICVAFLTQALTIEDEMDRLREELQGLVEAYTEQLPIRAVRVAIKVIRARKKLAEHKKDAMDYASQATLEAFVAEQLTALETAKRQAAAEAEQSTKRPVPDMTKAG